MSKTTAKKKKSSLDYPLMAQKLFEASGEGAFPQVDESEDKAGLYIVATPIGHLGDISLRALMVLAQADIIACEDTRISGAMLAKYGIRQKLVSYHDHNADARRPEIMKQLKAGATVALISDAGMPLIADPGFTLVRECRELGLEVTVIPGANAALTALAGSGLPTAPFYFGGFLPPKSKARQQAAAAVASMPATLIFYEAPQRLVDTLKDLAAMLGENRPAAVARELTKLFEETRRGTLAELAAHYAAHEARGEIVIVVGPGDSVPAHDLDAVLRDCLARMSIRDAVDAACGVTGVRKSAVYARALQLTGRADEK